MRAKKSSAQNFWTQGNGSFVLAILAALFLRWVFIEAYVIPSTSMLPTLLVNDHIFVNKIIYGLRYPFTSSWLLEWDQPKRGEVVVFKYPENPSLFYVKRIVGIPGDKIFYEDGHLFINEQLIKNEVPKELQPDSMWLTNEDFPGDGPSGKNLYVHWEEKFGNHSHSVLIKKDNPSDIKFGPYEVPPRHFFVMGDNRDNSQDSRFWQKEKRFVPRENLVGRAMVVWLSCEKTLPFLPFLCDPTKIRWSRFFHYVY